MEKCLVISRWLVMGMGLGVLALFMTGTHASAGQPEPSRKLNVLFIAVDDLNVHLGCYGYPVRTPNIDRLAQRGRRFDRAYCQYPLCNPSRTSLMSGWRPENTKVWGNEVPPRPHLQGAIPLQEYFHANGYFTARAGKIYHGAFERQFQWDNVEGTAGQTTSQPPSADSDPPKGKGVRPRGGESEQRGAKERGGNVVPITWRATDRQDDEEPDGRTARRIVQIIEQNKDRRFFIAAGFSKPHLPWTAPRKYFEMYPPATIRFGKDPENDREDIPAIAGGPNRPADPASDADRRQAIAAYHACVSFMDAQVGVLLEALDRLKLWDNTIVVFLGDNGFHLGEHGLWRKMTLFEESTRVPLIMVAPAMKQPGAATRHLAEFVDVYPTLLELCGLPAVPKLEGVSLVPLLNDPDRVVKTAAFSVVLRDELGLGKSVRTERYRYTEWPDGTAELYDHQTDPYEYVNSANKPEQAATVGELKALLHAGDKAVLVNK